MRDPQATSTISFSLYIVSSDSLCSSHLSNWTALDRTTNNFAPISPLSPLGSFHFINNKDWRFSISSKSSRTIGMASNYPFPDADPSSAPAGPLGSPSITVTSSIEFPQPQIRPGLAPIQTGGPAGRPLSLSPKTAIPTSGLTDGAVSYAGTARSMEDVLGQLVDTLTPKPHPPRSAIAEKLDAGLPPLLGDVRDGRINTYSAAAVVTTLFAGVEATLLTGNVPQPPSTKEFRGGIGIQRFYFFLTYSALALNLGATVGSLFLIDFLGSLSYQATSRPIPSYEPRTIRRLLMHYLPQKHGEPGWAYPAIEWHWYITFYMGSACIFCQFLCYIWLYEVDLMAAVITPIVVVSLLPFIFVIFL